MKEASDDLIKDICSVLDMLKADLTISNGMTTTEALWHIEERLEDVYDLINAVEFAP